MAEWKLCSDKGLSALPAAISERCHRYGDGRLFSLIIGNCECVSVPVHGYSNIKDTCQRKPVLWIWWAQQLLWKCTGLCLMCSQMRRVVGAVDADIKLFMKGPWRKRALTENLSHCLRLTKQKLTYVQWNSGEVREIKWKKKNQWYCSRRDVWGLHVMLSLWWYLTLKRSWEMCSREGRLGHVSLL